MLVTSPPTEPFTCTNFAHFKEEIDRNLLNESVDTPQS